jgi:hypothetical protein
LPADPEQALEVHPAVQRRRDAVHPRPDARLFSADFVTDRKCLTRQNLHFSLTYHPGERYWTFQWIETSICFLLALLPAGFCFWRLPRGLN